MNRDALRGGGLVLVSVACSVIFALVALILAPVGDISLGYYDIPVGEVAVFYLVAALVLVGLVAAWVYSTIGRSGGRGGLGR